MKTSGILALGFFWLALGVFAMMLGCGGDRAPRPTIPNVLPAIDAIEIRLLTNQARVHHWQEMKGRHAEVSRLFCDSTTTRGMRVASR